MFVHITLKLVHIGMVGEQEEKQSEEGAIRVGDLPASTNLYTEGVEFSWMNWGFIFIFAKIADYDSPFVGAIYYNPFKHSANNLMVDICHLRVSSTLHLFQSASQMIELLHINGLVLIKLIN